MTPRPRRNEPIRPPRISSRPQVHKSGSHTHCVSFVPDLRPRANIGTVPPGFAPGAGRKAGLSSRALRDVRLSPGSFDGRRCSSMAGTAVPPTASGAGRSSGTHSAAGSSLVAPTFEPEHGQYAADLFRMALRAGDAFIASKDERLELLVTFFAFKLVDGHPNYLQRCRRVQSFSKNHRRRPRRCNPQRAISLRTASGKRRGGCRFVSPHMRRNARGFGSSPPGISIPERFSGDSPQRVHQVFSLSRMRAPGRTCLNATGSPSTFPTTFTALAGLISSPRLAGVGPKKMQKALPVGQ